MLQANTTLEAQLRQLQRQLQKARAQGEALDAQHGEQRATRPRGEQRGGAKGRPSRPGSSASIDPAERQHVEARQLANAQKQLAYYTRESEMLHKKMARVRSVDHLSVLEATVAAKQTALEEARRRGRELAREAKEQDRRLDNCVRGVEDPSKELASLGEDVRVARKHAARLAEDNARDARELKKGSALAADVEAEVGAAPQPRIALQPLIALQPRIALQPPHRAYTPCYRATHPHRACIPSSRDSLTLSHTLPYAPSRLPRRRALSTPAPVRAPWWRSARRAPRRSARGRRRRCCSRRPRRRRARARSMRSTGSSWRARSSR